MESNTQPQMVFDSSQQIRDAYNTGDKKKDLEVINAVLSGQVGIKQPDQPVGEPTAQIVANDEPKIETPNIVNGEPVVDEIEQSRRYAEFLEQKQKENELKYMSELKAREDLIAKEKAEREALEVRIRELSELKQHQPSTVDGTLPNEDEDEAYVTEYAKRTRKMVEELRTQSGSSDVVKRLEDEINSIKRVYDEQKQESMRLQQEKAKAEKEQKLFDGLRQFQSKYPELQTQKDIKEIDQEYTTFRRNLGALVNAKSVVEVDAAIKNYYDNGSVKTLAEQKGIKPVTDYNKYTKIVNLIDEKNGVVFDPITGQTRPILDEEGNQVRYRSLEEVYRIKKYYDDISNARKQTLKEVSQKLNSFNNSPVTLSNEQTEAFTGGFSTDQEREILNWPPQIWEKDPQKRAMVEQVYNKHGIKMPRYRGK